MGENALNDTTRNADGVAPEALEYLKQEIEHYYNAELQHEQRANWLMVTTIALVGFAGNKFIEEWESLNCYAQIFFLAGMLLLAISVMASIVAIWPLVGRKGRLVWYPSRRTLPPMKLPDDTAAALVQHCEAHRLRAVVRARQVIWALIPFVLGLIVLALGLATILW